MFTRLLEWRIDKSSIEKDYESLIDHHISGNSHSRFNTKVESDIIVSNQHMIYQNTMQKGAPTYYFARIKIFRHHDRWIPRTKGQ